MSNRSASVKRIEKSESQESGTESQTIELIPSVNYLTKLGTFGPNCTNETSSLDSILFRLRTLGNRNKEGDYSEMPYNEDENRMSSKDFFLNEQDSTERGSGEESDASNSELSFTHYLFIKTDFSISRLSRKLIQQFNNINLNDDDYLVDNLNERYGNSSNENHGESQRKRSVSEELGTPRTTRSKSYHRLSPSLNFRKKSEIAAKAARNKHQYEDWLDNHHNSTDNQSKVTKIIRIDINEIDNIETSDFRKVHYLDDLFHENNVNKFYTLDRGKLSNKSIYLATNASLSGSSDDLEASDKSNAKKKKKRIRQSHKKKSYTSPTAELRQKKKKHGMTRHDKEKREKSRRRRNSETSTLSLEKEYSADTRSYHTKKHEINDDDLAMFLGSGRMNKRRNAIVHKIDMLYKEGELHSFMENMLRQDYIETFLL